MNFKEIAKKKIRNLVVVEVAVFLLVVDVHVEQRADQAHPMPTFGLEKQDGPSRFSSDAHNFYLNSDIQMNHSTQGCRGVRAI